MRAIGVMCVGAAALALAACGQGDDGADSAGAAAESSTPAAANAPAAGGQVREARTAEAVSAMIPKRRAGKWRMQMGLGGQASMPPQEICMTEEQVQNEPTWDPGQAGAGCPDFRARRQGDTIVMTANCPNGQGGSVQMESRLTGDFQNRYRIESVMRQNPAPAGQPAEIRTFLDMTYVGPC